MNVDKVVDSTRNTIDETTCTLTINWEPHEGILVKTMNSFKILSLIFYWQPNMHLNQLLTTLHIITTHSSSHSNRSPITPLHKIYNPKK